MAITLINLTPHVLNILNNDHTMLAIPTTGNIARVSSTTEKVLDLDGLTVTRSIFGQVEGLPEPEEGTFYIVSRMVKDRVPSRDDVLVPGSPVRDAEGRIIGADGLSL